MEFAFDFDPRYRAWLRLFGARPDHALVTVGDEELAVRFGRRRMATGLGNVESVQITDGYRAYRAIGIRVSLADRGITFGTNTRRGVCVCFRQPVGGVVPGLKHPGMTVTVADVDGLVAVLEAAIGEVGGG